MGARKRVTDESKYISRLAVKPTTRPVSLLEVATYMPDALRRLSRSFINTARGHAWQNYKPVIENEVAYIRNEYCERCGKVVLAPAQRKLQELITDAGPMYLDTGICKDCINAGVYIDKYLDGKPLSEREAKELFYRYAAEYERQWRVVLAAAPNILLSEDSWRHTTEFFNGCAFCGGYISARQLFFPSTMNGTYSPWNVIPVCENCKKNRHTIGQRPRKDITAAPRRFQAFSSRALFQKTKTIRLYLLAQMEVFGLYTGNLLAYRKRFYETKLLPYSVQIVISPEITEALIILARKERLVLYKLFTLVKTLHDQGISDETLMLATLDGYEALERLALQLRLEAYAAACRKEKNGLD